MRSAPPELALVAGSNEVAEISADMASRELKMFIWLVGGEALRRMKTGFWVRIADADVFFSSAGMLFNRARFEATQVLVATDPTPRTPDVWLFGSRPLGSTTGEPL